MHRRKNDKLSTQWAGARGLGILGTEILGCICFYTIIAYWCQCYVLNVLNSCLIRYGWWPSHFHLSFGPWWWRRTDLTACFSVIHPITEASVGTYFFAIFNAFFTTFLQGWQNCVGCFCGSSKRVSMEKVSFKSSWYSEQLHFLADFPLSNCPPHTLHSFSNLEIWFSFIPTNTMCTIILC